MADTQVEKREYEAEHDAKGNGDDQMKMYLRFGAMIATAMVVMFGLTYVNTYELFHVRWSETRLFMTLLMGGAMAIVMLGFMLGMYRSRALNVAVVIAGLALIALGTSSLALRRRSRIVRT